MPGLLASALLSTRLFLELLLQSPVGTESVTAVLTAFYLARLYALTFEGAARMDYKTKSRVHEFRP